MKCWLIRLAQKRWGLPAAETARIFRQAGVYAYVSDLYDLLHLSSYERALDNIETYLTAKGIRYASFERRPHPLPRQLRFHRMPYVRGERALWDLTKRP